MKLRPAHCPQCRHEATGILETIIGTAELSFDAGDRTFSYGGYTKVNWDSQESLVDDKGKVTLTCGNHEWKAKVTRDP